MNKQIKPYRLKHVPTGLYYQPIKGGNNLSKRGKVYLTKIHGLTSTMTYAKRYPDSKQFEVFWIYMRKNSNIHKEFKDKFKWEDSIGYNEVKTATKLIDWIKEEL